MYSADQLEARGWCCHTAKKFSEVGSHLFLKTNRFFKDYEDAASPIAGNSVRSMKKKKGAIGASKILNGYFCEEKDFVVSRLKKIRKPTDYESLIAEIQCEIKKRLKNNIESASLNTVVKPKPRKTAESYNQIRKLIDLCVMSVVAQSLALKNERKSLIPIINPPLDSKLIRSYLLFSKKDWDRICGENNKNNKGGGIGPQSTYSSIITESAYQDAQAHLGKLSSSLKNEFEVEFFPIFFELIWNERFLHTVNPAEPTTLYELSGSNPKLDKLIRG